MPRRFKRDVVAAAKDSENRIVMEGMQRVLQNIGAGQKLSENELKTLFTELGENGVISVSRMSTLLWLRDKLLFLPKFLWLCGTITQYRM